MSMPGGAAATMMMPMRSWPLLALLVVPAADIKKAKEAGYHTIQAIVMTTKRVGHPVR